MVLSYHQFKAVTVVAVIASIGSYYGLAQIAWGLLILDIVVAATRRFIRLHVRKPTQTEAK